jgi:hypothetical protein
VQEIANAIAHRKCVVFAGAGLSCNAGLPNWAELVRHLFNNLSQQGKIASQYDIAIKNLLDSNELSKCMDLLLLASNRKDLLYSLREALKPRCSSSIHETLKKLHLRGYITTNYDRLLDGVCESMCFRLNNSLEKLSLVPTALGRPSGQFILKLHGDIDDESPPEHDFVAKGGPFIVLSKSDYTVMLQGDRGDALKLALHSVLQEASVLFLGYNFTDPDILLALDFLSKHCQFPHKSWFLGLSQKPVPQLPGNISSIQPISEWSQLDGWLKELAKQVQVLSADTALKEIPPYEVPEKDRRALLALREYVYGLETEDLFSKTILSILVPELRQKSTVTENWLSQFIGGLLDVGPNWAEAFTKATLGELVNIGLIQPGAGPDGFSVNVSRLNTLYVRANAEWQEERSAFIRSIKHRLHQSGIELSDDQLFSQLDEVLQILFMEYGHIIAGWIHRGIGEELGLPHIHDVVVQHFMGDETRRKIEDLLRLVFENPSDGETSYIYRLLSSAFLLNSVKLDPTASKFVQESVAQYQLYLDANVLLPLIVREHRNHRSVASIISMSAEAGVGLFVLEDILEEVLGHRKLAQDIYDSYRSDLDALSMQRAILGRRTNCFIEGYLNIAQREGLSWNRYVNSYNESQIVQTLDSFRVRVVKVDTKDFDPILYGEVLGAIEEEWDKRLHGLPRNRALNRHEAKQFLQVYTQRKSQVAKGRSDDVWFLSSETVFEKVFLRAPQKWGQAELARV